MIKIFLYELKRTITSKLFPGILLANGFFAWYVLTTDIILGTCFTAPFSLWSYCTYLGKVMPISIIAMLLLLANYHGKKQKKVEILTTATPVTLAKQILIRTLLIFVCFTILCLMMIALALFFYLHFFDFHDFKAFIFPTVLVVFPCFFFFSGLGQLLGKFHGSLIYLLIFFTGIAGFYPNGTAIDPFGAGYFSTYPLTLPPGNYDEPDFTIEISFLITRFLYFLGGIICMAIPTILSEHKPKKA